MTTRKRRDSSNGLTGWTDAIQRAGEQSRSLEAERKQRAERILGAARGLSLENQLRVLLVGVDDGDLSISDLLTALRKAIEPKG